MKKKHQAREPIAVVAQWPNGGCQQRRQTIRRTRFSKVRTKKWRLVPTSAGLALLPRNSLSKDFAELLNERSSWLMLFV